MNEKLLADYIKSKRLSIYPDFTIEDIQSCGGCVMFKERDSSRYYTEDHKIELIDILAWMYSNKN